MFAHANQKSRSGNHFLRGRLYRFHSDNSEARVHHVTHHRERVSYLNKRHLEKCGVILRGQMDWWAYAPSAIMLKECCKDQPVTCLIINLDNSCQCHFKTMLVLFCYHIRYTRSVILWVSDRGIRYILKTGVTCQVLFVTTALHMQKWNTNCRQYVRTEPCQKCATCSE